jgi:hypothetical protein
MEEKIKSITIRKQKKPLSVQIKESEQEPERINKINVKSSTIRILELIDGGEF